jgi:hypothetical protein
MPKSDYVPADKITKSVLLDLAAKYPVIWTYVREKKTRKLYFSCDNGKATLILSVTLGPRFPTWSMDLLNSALKRAGINPTVAESEAFKPPPCSVLLG